MTLDQIRALLPEPYYEDESGLLYNADCLEIMKLMPDKCVDLVVTDPPYGVDLGSKKYPAGSQHGLVKGEYLGFQDTYENFLESIVPGVQMAISKALRGMVWIAAHRIPDLPRFSSMGGVYCPSANGRDCWGFTTFLPVLLYGHDPTIVNGSRSKVLVSNDTAESNGHPCPKPLSWMNWCVVRGSETNQIIFDPFFGSGTTGVASKQLGRKWIGIEISEKYCEIAATRLRQGQLNLTVK
jgi:site-specific DNA-methyltransferase (adenine-specific)